MSGRMKTLRVKVEKLDAKGARSLVSRLRGAAAGFDLTVDLGAVAAIEPEAAAMLAALAVERKAAGLKTEFPASHGVAEALAAASAKEQPQTNEQPSDGGERREGSRTSHPRSVAVPRLPEQGASMTDFGTIIAAVLARKWLLLAVVALAAGAGLSAGKLLGSATFVTEAVMLYKPSDNELSDEYEVLQNIDATTTFIYRQGSRKEQGSGVNVQIKTLLNTVKIPANLEAVRAALGLKVSLSELGTALEVRVQKETELMSVRATWADAATAAALANGIVDVFIEANRRINKENVASMRDRLASRLADTQAQLLAVSADLAAFSQRYRILDLKKESEQYIQELIRLKAMRDEAASRKESLKVQLRDLDAGLADLRKTIAAEKAEAGKKPSATEIEAQIAAINMQLEAGKAKRAAMAELMAKNADYERVRQLYAEGLASKTELDKAFAAKEKTLAQTQDDPEAAKLMKEIEALKATRSKLPAGSTASERLAEELALKRFNAQLELVAAEGAVEAYEQSAKRVQTSIDGMPSVNKEYARLSTENAGLEAEKKGLERMLAQANLVLEKGASDFSVIAPAPVPVYPAKSNRKMLAIGVGIVVIVLGWGILLLIEILDARIRSGKEAAAALGIRVLASFQHADRSRLMPGGREDQAHIEEYRLLALKLRRLLSRKGEKILVASVMPGAGKSVVAANLASAWGKSEEKVLIVEADLRKSAHPWPLEAFATPAARTAPAAPAGQVGQAGQPGLAEFLNGGTEDLGRIARPSILPGVDLLGRGTEEAFPDQLGRPRFAELLAQASSLYGLTLIEAPEALKRADAAMIGGHCNAILLVLRSRSASPAAVSRALDVLGRERVIGVVMTDVGKAFAKRDAT